MKNHGSWDLRGSFRNHDISLDPITAVKENDEEEKGMTERLAMEDRKDDSQDRALKEHAGADNRRPARARKLATEPWE